MFKVDRSEVSVGSDNFSKPAAVTGYRLPVAGCRFVSFSQLEACSSWLVCWEFKVSCLMFKVDRSEVSVGNRQFNFSTACGCCRLRVAGLFLSRSWKLAARGWFVGSLKFRV